MKDLVHCRAEYAYPGRPLEVWHGEHWQQVTEVLEEMYTPAGKHYRVSCEGKNEFWLVYDPVLDSWQVTAVGETGTLQNKESK